MTDAFASLAGREILTGPYAHMTYAEKFWGQVNVCGLNDCWEFTSYLYKNGYGRFGVGRKGVLAHRFAYWYVYRSMPNGLSVCHRCDNRKCCNPFYLFAGTAADNANDMIRKGRANPARGERNWQSKLTADDVIRMRRLRLNGMSQKEIAPLFGISRKQVSCVVRGVQWAHITGEADGQRDA